MKRLGILIGVILLFCGCIVYVFYVNRQQRTIPQTTYDVPASNTFFLASTAFAPGIMIPSFYTCDGENVSPPLVIGNIPDKTKTLVLILDDMDTPQGTWVHWILWNISPDRNKIEQGIMPDGAVPGKNSFGNSSYGGPCPPSGRHRYVFRLYALDTALVLPFGSQKQAVIDAMNTHVIAQTEYVGVYARE